MMSQTRTAARAAPAVQMPARSAKQEQNSRATLDDFERERMGIAAKE
jgi:hypothetical protein